MCVGGTGVCAPLLGRYEDNDGDGDSPGTRKRARDVHAHGGSMHALILRGPLRRRRAHDRHRRARVGRRCARHRGCSEGWVASAGRTNERKSGGKWTQSENGGRSPTDDIRRWAPRIRRKWADPRPRALAGSGQSLNVTWSRAGAGHMLCYDREGRRYFWTGCLLVNKVVSARAASARRRGEIQRGGGAPRQQVRDGGQLWSVPARARVSRRARANSVEWGRAPRGVVVQLEERDREQLHVLGHREHLCSR
jgi:hypothetical protein